MILVCRTCGGRFEQPNGRPRHFCEAHVPASAAVKRRYYVANREKLCAQERERSARARAARKRASDS